MKNRREMVLRELGLTPIWLSRDAAPVSSPEDALAQGTEAKLGQMVVHHRHRGASESTVTETHPLPAGKDAGAADRRAIILKMDWPDLKAAVASCTACRLHEARTRTVFGVGDEKASWLFVGEGPGADEDLQGEPFVGQAGKLLDNMLAAIDLRRGDDVYIANIVKCRPPKNRNPEPGEVASCEPYLTRQIQLIQPKLIVALGKVAVQNLLDTDAAVGSLRGRLHAHSGIPLIVTYHPAYLLRNLPDKARAWEDLCFARATMATLKSAPAPT